MEISHRIILYIIDGPTKGQQIQIEEQNNILIGRDEKGSQANLKISQMDKKLSRNHFLLEINPPDCYIRDVGSLNGTFIIRKNENESLLLYLHGREPDRSYKLAQQYGRDYTCTKLIKIENRNEIHHHDLIIVGDTKIEIQILETKSKKHGIKTEKVNELYSCIRCGKNIYSQVFGKRVTTLLAIDFICPECRKKETISLQLPATCWHCGENVADIANADGKAADFKEIALYLCNKCMKCDNIRIRIGEYQIIRELGAGGFGNVFLGRHEKSGRIVALKVTKDKIKHDRRLLQRFKREIAIMQDFNHANLVRLYGEGITKGGNLYFASEYLPEGSISDLVARSQMKKLPYPYACRLVSMALDGLSYFHKKKYVHRDLKPENILVRKDAQGNDIAKIGDFGLAKNIALHGGTITKPLEWAGTIFYCAPEQITNFKNALPPADIYSIGITLYHMLSNEFPYDFPSRNKYFEMLKNGIRPRDPWSIILGNDKPVPIENKIIDLPKELAEVINRSIQKDPKKRIRTAEEFKKTLERYAK